MQQHFSITKVIYLVVIIVLSNLGTWQWYVIAGSNLGTKFLKLFDQHCFASCRWTPNFKLYVYQLTRIAIFLEELYSERALLCLAHFELST